MKYQKQSSFAYFRVYLIEIISKILTGFSEFEAMPSHFKSPVFPF